MTKSINILELTANDGWPQAVQKLNQNFKSLWSSSEFNGTVQTSAAESRLVAKIDEAIEILDRKTTEAIERIDDRVNEASKALDDVIDRISKLELKVDPKLYAPAIGTYLYSKEDPGKTWIGTTWEKLTGGKYLISADDSLPTESTVGTNNQTLTLANIPAHSHKGPKHTHSGPSHQHTVGAHKHGLGSHTHGVGSYATGSDGSHSHGTYGGDHWKFVTIEDPGGLAHGKAWTNSTTGNYWSPWSTADLAWATPKTTGSAGSHTHTISGTSAAATGNTADSTQFNTGYSGTGNTGEAGDGDTSSAGSGTSFDNRPYSIAVPLWRRIA